LFCCCFNPAGDLGLNRVSFSIGVSVTVSDADPGLCLFWLISQEMMGT
jgi:hypothetical protein